MTIFDSKTEYIMMQELAQKAKSLRIRAWENKREEAQEEETETKKPL